MDVHDVYAKIEKYDAVARSRGARDSERVALETAARLWTLIERGRAVDESIERLVLNGCILDEVRRQTREAPPTPLVREDDQTVPAPPRPLTLADSLFSAALYMGLTDDAIPNDDRVAWAMVNLNGLTQAEAAEYLGVPQQRVSEMVERQRLKLKEALA